MPTTTNAAPTAYRSPIRSDLRLRARDPRRPMRAVIILTVAVLACGMAAPTAGSKTPATAVTIAADPHFAIPISLLEEHAGLYSAFETASRMPGETGRAARYVAALLVPHVAKEQRIAYPLLRLLPMLVDGKAEPWMAELLPLAAQLRAEWQALKDEHVAIGRALDVLQAEAWAEEQSQYAFLAERLRRHIQTEEEVLFPAALVTAEYLRGRLSP
jgi:hypothetical protein